MSRKKSAVSMPCCIVALFLALMFALVNFASAATVSVPSDRVYITSKQYPLVSGATETVLTTNNTEGNDQRIGYLLEVDSSNFNGADDSTLKIVACYKDASYDTLGFQTVTDQAAAYEKKHPGETVIAGINGSFFNMNTGAPTGLFVMDGQVCNNSSSYPYFAILNDGTAVIRNGSVSSSDVYQAVAGNEIIVSGGENVVGNSDYGEQKYSRTAIGIKADGSVVTYVTHGISTPTSCGESYSDVADLLIAQGCETALMLDGGGSSTYASMREGTDSLVVQNNPSDGTPRTVSATLLVVSTASATGEFDHAGVTPNNEYYTPSLSNADTVVQFEATGIDTAGVACDLPSGLVWSLTDESSSMGSIDASTGLFTAAVGKTGTVEVQLLDGDTVVGSTEIRLAEPDELYFSSEALSLDFSQTTDLGLTVKGQGVDLNIKDGDLVWDFDSALGSVTDNLFTSAEKTDATLSGDVTVRYTKANSEVLQATVSLEIGKLPVVAMDFETYDREDNVGLQDWGNAGSYFTDTDETQIYTFQNYDYLFYLQSTTLSDDSQWINETYFTECPWNENDDGTVTVHWNGNDYEGTKTEYYGEYADPNNTFGEGGTRESTGAEAANKWVEFSADGIDYYFRVLYKDSYFSGSYNAKNAAAAILAADGYDMYFWHTSANPNSVENMYGQGAGIVDSSTGEVRFGENALKLTYDFSNFTPTSGTKNCNSYWKMTDPLVAEGSPTGLGMWVYAPEGMPNYWFWTYITYWDGSKWVDTTLHFQVAGAEKSLQYSGINWTGWAYVEADLSPIYEAGAVVDAEHPVQVRSGMALILLTYIPGGTSDGDGNVVVCGAPTSGYFYIDNVRWVYGTTVDDLDNPEILSVTANETPLSSEEAVTLTENTLSFTVNYTDPQGENYSGIDEEGTQLFLDGVPLSADQFAVNSDRAQTVDMTLANGEHTLLVSICDNFGNKTEESYFFIVANEDSELPGIRIDRQEQAELGGDYMISVAGEQLSDVASMSVSITYGNTSLLETETRHFTKTGNYDDYGNELTLGDDGFYYTEDGELFEQPVSPNSEDDYPIPSAVLTLGSGVTKVGNIRALADGSGNRTFTATVTVDEGTKEGTLATFDLPVPHTLAKTDTIPYCVTVSFTMNDGENYTVTTGNRQAELWAYYSIEPGVQIAGAESSDLKITAYDGSAVDTSNLKVYGNATTEITKNGSFSDGVFCTDWFVSQAAGTTLNNVWVGDDANGHYSFYTTVKVASAAENDSVHYDVVLNSSTAGTKTSQRITWLATPESNGSAVVQYMTAGEYKASAQTDDEIFTTAKEAEGTAELTQFNIDNVAAYINNVTITGLTPGTTYYFRAGDGENWSDVSTFQTYSGSETSFVVVGDTQLSGDDAADENDIETLLNIGKAVNGSVDFGIQTGDYVDGGTEYGEWEQIMRVWNESFTGLDFVHVQGNHETYGDEGSAISAAMFGLSDDETQYYSVEYGDVYIAVINQSANLNDAAAWLIEDAAKSDCTWKIMTCHQPVYYTNPNGSSEGHYNVLAPACDAAGIDVVFSGHDHSYARTEMQYDRTAVDLEFGTDNYSNNIYLDEDGNIAASKDMGTVYFICGDLGEKSRESSYRVVANESFHFAKTDQTYDALYLTVSADENKLTVQAWNMDANGGSTLLDSFSIYTGVGACEEIGEHILSADEALYNPETGNLVCSRCGEEFSPKDLNYTGFATDVNGEDEYGDSRYYFLAGTLQTGFFTYGEEWLYANSDGLIDHETYTYSSATCTVSGKRMVVSPRYNKTHTGETIPFEGHQYTEQADGSLVCSVCGHVAIDIADWDFSLSYSAMTYTGSALTPAVTIKNPDTGEKLTFHTDGMGLITDYRRVYSNNKNVGVASVAVTANPYGDYTNSNGEVTLTFQIRPALATNVTAAVSEKIGTVELSWTAGGGADTYAVYYSTNGNTWKKAGTTGGTSYTVTGLNQNTEYSFKIRSQATVDGVTYNSIYYTDPVSVITGESCDLSGYTIQTSYESSVYSGSEKTPAVTVTAPDGTVLKKNTDYTVSYADNLNVGTATVTVTGIGNYSGTVKTTFDILPADLTACTVTLGTYDEVYNGSAKTPSVTVRTAKGTKLSEGKNYSVEYKNNINPGTATVVLTGINNYSGTLTAEFTIKEGTVTLSTPTLNDIKGTSSGITVTWNSVKGAEGYRVFRKTSGGSWTKLKDTTSLSYTDKTVKAGTSYTYTVRCINGNGEYVSSYNKTGLTLKYAATPTLSSISATSSGITLKWNKATGAVNYKVFRKTSGGSWKALGTTTGTSYTDKTGVYGTKYTYTVRCVTSDGKTYTGGYNTTGKSATALNAGNLSTPKLSSVQGSSSGVTVKWSKVSGAEKYRVFRKTTNGSWKKLKDTTSLSYTDTTAKTGTKYIYTVRCISSDGKTYTSGYDKTGLTIKYTATPKLSSVQGNSNGVTVKWSKVSGAEKYRVFRKTTNGSWKKLKDTTSLSYTDTTAKAGTKYIYTVRCISSDGKTYTSGYDKTGLTIKYTATPKLSSVQGNSNGVTVKWSKVSGAEKYRVFRKTADGSWKKLKDTTSLSYTDTTAKTGTKYIYTVRCISSDGKTYTSGYDKTGLTIKYTATPKLSGIKAGSGGVTVKWSKVSGAEKYRVFRKTANGSWTKLTDTTSLSYTDKTAKAGTKYIYTVRCISSDGKTYAGGYDKNGLTITP